MELIKINTTNYYKLLHSIPFVEGCFIDLKANDNFAIVLNKSGLLKIKARKKIAKKCQG